MLPPDAEVSQYRQSVDGVTTLARRDLLRVWRGIDKTNGPDAIRDALLATVPTILAQYHLVASTTAADFYDLARDLLGAKKRFQAVMSPEPAPSASQALVRWGVGPVYSSDPNPALVLSLVAGGLQRLVANGARQTIVGSTLADPVRVGWVRVGVGECDWCQQYIDGEIHYTAGYDFEAHDRCRCDAVPAI